MIRELTEKHIEDTTDEELAAYISDDAPLLEPAAIPILVSLHRQPPAVRGAVARYLKYTKLFCVECGETSCIHGYSDE
jgi:hypothetical protein